MITPLAIVFEISADTIRENLPQILVVLVGITSILILVNEYLKNRERNVIRRLEENYRLESIKAINTSNKDVDIEWGARSNHQTKNKLATETNEGKGKDNGGGDGDGDREN
jgi:hypothetical protein